METPSSRTQRVARGVATLTLGVGAAIGNAGTFFRPVVDLRLRHEAVAQEPFIRDADATTLRLRLGAESVAVRHTTLLIEGEANLPFGSEYNSTSNGHTAYPVVADPENYALNRLQLRNDAIKGTTVTLGRQRLNLDDQRFIGSVGWRQNEQTFDALRIVNKPRADLTLDVTYANQVNRIFGRDALPGANAGTLHGDNLFANAAWQSRFGKLTAFGYLVEFRDSPQVRRDDTKTFGLRYAGERTFAPIKLAYVLTAATQRDYADNPLSFRIGYSLGELTASWSSYSLGAGIETLEGDGIKGFTTPLATLHRFQGWADKFLTTPVDGICDVYVNAGWQRKLKGPLDTVSLSLAWHDYDAQRGSRDYGSELDLQLQARFKRVTAMLKYADYFARAATPAPLRDTRKLWAQLEYVWQ